MDCPTCDVEMSELEGDDTTLRKCGDCGGLWIDVADLNRILLHNGLPGLEGLGGKINQDSLTGQCRDCLVDLVAIEGGDRAHPMNYDMCESCGGMFLESEFKDISDAQAAFAEIVTFFKKFSERRSKTAAG